VARIDNRGAQHEIFGRISDEGELRQHDEIGAIGSSPIACAPDACEVAVDVAYSGIELCERDGELQGEPTVLGSAVLGAGVLVPDSRFVVTARALALNLEPRTGTQNHRTSNREPQLPLSMQ
jgi:hypothetical protein